MRTESYEKREQASEWAKKLTPLLLNDSLKDERLEVWDLAGVSFVGFSYCWLDNQYGAEYRWVCPELWHNRSIQDFEAVDEAQASQFVDYCESKFKGVFANA
jgi:hypothetical protein